jgi:nicotinamide riboside transporter PnuC
VYWSYVLAAIGVTGTFFVGRRVIWAWLVLLVNECLWMIYAITTKQYGFIFAALAYAIVYIRSYIHWSKEPVNNLPL